MHRCCVLGCTSKVGSQSLTTFHLFPPDEDVALKKEWVNAVGRINWEPALSSRVCSKHFKDEDYVQCKSKKRLKKDAVPSINVGLCDTMKMAKMSAKECVIPTCSSQYSEAPYFHFPKDKSLCLKWLLAIPKGNWSLNQDSQVCSRHFEKSDVVTSNIQAWLRTGSVPKWYLDSPTMLSKETTIAVTMKKPEVGQDSDAGKSRRDDATPGPSGETEKSTPSTSQDVDLIEEGDGVYKIKLDADGGSESDLEIIEPEIETYEVSDTSDEGEPPPKPAVKEPLLTSLKLQVNEVRSLQPTPSLVVKSGVSSNGRVIRGDSKMKCCVPRCGSVAGNPPRVGFHSFPKVGETRLSVRSLDNQLTVHDLFSMWKSLLSVKTITNESFVCTRHFTPNDYSNGVLNKVAVPTQFLPTPVMFAPCKVQDSRPTQPPPLVLLNKSKNPPPILRKPVKPSYPSYAMPPIRFPGIPSINKVTCLTRVIPGNRGRTPVTHSPRPPPRLPQPNIPPNRVPVIAPRPLMPIVRPSPPPVCKKPKLGCSITNCSNKVLDDNNKAVLFRLPYNIDKCKEWVYSCGHPEWLDKGMVIARSVYRICSLHFANEMFLDASHKTLKGSAKPTIDVQEPYKKCIVKHCCNYYDKDRLHYIGVDFATFPTESNLFNSWVKAVKCNTDVPKKSVQVTEEDVTNFTGAVICSLHFRNSDYIAGPNGKSLSSKAVPTMNLMLVKEPEVKEPEPEIINEPDPPQAAAQNSELKASPSGAKLQYAQRPRRRPYLGRRRRRGRRPGWGKAKPIVNEDVGEDDVKEDNEQKESSEGNVEKGQERSTLEDKEEGDESNVPAHGEQVEIEPNKELLVEETFRPSPSKRGRPYGRTRGGRGGGRRAAKLPIVEDSDEELEEKLDDEGPSSRRRKSSRIETLYGPRGRPLRSAVLKRKSFIESGSESQGSDEELAPRKKRGHLKKHDSSDDNSDVVVRRSLRPRRAATSKKFIVDDTESEEDDKDEWRQDNESDAPMDYGGGVAEGGHFLDPVLGVEPFPEEPGENTFAQPAEDASTQSAENNPAHSAENNPAHSAENNPAHSAENISDQPAEQVDQPIHMDVSEQQEDVTMASDVEGISIQEVEQSTNQTPKAIDVVNEQDGPEPKNDSGSEVGASVTIAETCDADNTSNERDRNDVEGEPSTEDNTTGNDVESSVILETNDISDAQKEVIGENIDKEPRESQATQDDKTNGTLHVSEPEDNVTMPLEDKENAIPFGPKLPIPSLADIEFFRSIIPGVASFNQRQKHEFRSTIISTLKEMLNEDLGIEVSSPELNDSGKDEYEKIPDVGTVESM